MADIVLSSSVRQNLLSLQSTASLLATTQSRLSTGNKVNSALDNPTNYFTSQSLNNRASDISNLLDGVSNGVQVLQAANTGITSLQKLVDSAKSVANQALQASVGYSTKANITSAAVTNSGSAVGASDLRGLGTVVDNSVTGAVVNLGSTTGTIAATTALSALGTAGTAIADGDAITVNGKTITFNTSNTTTAQTSSTDPTGNTTFYLGTTGTAPKVSDLLSAIDTASGNTGTGSVASSVANSGAAGSALALHTGVNNDLVIGGASGVLSKLGLTAATTNRTGDTLSFTALGNGQATTITFGDGTGGTVKSLTDLNMRSVVTT